MYSYEIVFDELKDNSLEITKVTHHIVTNDYKDAVAHADKEIETQGNYAFVAIIKRDPILKVCNKDEKSKDKT